jgi:hypothetical protein
MSHADDEPLIIDIPTRWLCAGDSRARAQGDVSSPTWPNAVPTVVLNCRFVGRVASRATPIERIQLPIPTVSATAAALNPHRARRAAPAARCTT